MTARDVLAEPRTEAGHELLDWMRTTSRIEDQYRAEYIVSLRKDIVAIETEAALLATPQPEAGLDAAWAEVEAALPEGWRFHGLSPIGDRWHAIALGGHTDQKCDQGVIHQEYAKATAWEDTPVAALRALALALREPKP